MGSGQIWMSNIDTDGCRTKHFNLYRTSYVHQFRDLASHTHRHVRTYVRTYTHTHTHTHTHTRTHTYTHITHVDNYFKKQIISGVRVMKSEGGSGGDGCRRSMI